MRITIILIGVIGWLSACHNRPSTATNQQQTSTITTTVYSKAVGDSFSISISLPEDYRVHNKKYPVIFILDANLYFDVMAVTFKNFAPVGLAPEAIIVGLGYKDFYTMDSLRSRDYTFPVAIPEYEMPHSGGADKFLAFLKQELVPYIDSHYKTDTVQRVLAGHSLGGYFTCYALQQALTDTSQPFNYFVAASPSLHYNHYYLLKVFEKNALPTKSNKTIKAYITWGELEDNTNNSDSSFLKQNMLIKRLHHCFQAQVEAPNNFTIHRFSNLDHMETALPSFLKGANLLLATNP